MKRVTQEHAVLVVGDDRLVRESTASGLGEFFRVRTCRRAEARASLAGAAFDGVVVDVGSGGVDLGRMLGGADALRDTAVLVVAGHGADESTAIRAFEGGASDFLRRPFGFGELRARLIAAITARRTIADLRRLGSVDELTGLLNRRGFFEELERERRRASRESSILSVLVLDVDRFKAVNDVHGHAAGDLALAAVGEALSASCRVTDVAGRIGGEEFAVALPSTDAIAAAAVAEKLRAALSILAIALPGGARLSLTASFGAAAVHGDQLGTREAGLSLLALADSALFRAKRAGRDRVEAA